jgi:putative aldouronate transport system permease protein
LQMKEMGLTNTIWSVVLAGTVNVFYFVIMRNYFQSLPESLIESARLDGAGEWRILFDIILPLSKPIIATLTLFYLVDRWNEWYNALIFIRNTDLQPLQLVLRSIVMESSIVNNVTSAAAMEQMQNFNMGVKMAAVIVTILPVMCVYPFLQKHFAQGVMVGAVKA